MAGKRLATSDINHTNWNVEDDPEDAGTFSKAAEDVIKNRVIKVAKRRNPIGTLAAPEGENKSAFANFSGFNKPLPTPTPSTFGFLNVVTNKSGEQSKTNGIEAGVNKELSTSNTSLTSTNQSLENKILSNNQPKEYYAKLKGLNQSVSSWIKKHVDANPFLNLTPVFRDYEKYLEDVEHLAKKESGSSLNNLDFKIRSSTNTQFQTKSISHNTKSSESNNYGIISNFSKPHVINPVTPNLTNVDPTVKKTEKPGFEASSTSNISGSTPPYTFGISSAPSTTSITGFNFGTDLSKPFTLSNVAKPENSEQSNKNDEEDEEPPKAEFTPVIEEGHVYTIRCKVFVKKDGTFGDRGVGTLFLKPVPESDKFQLIVRANTNLGNLLCNFILSTNLPLQRMGKKDVMLVCIPTPENKPPPVPLLLRVKSPEDADELLRTLEKHKK